MEGVWADEYEEDDFLDYYGEAQEVPEPEARGKKAKALDPDDPNQPKKVKKPVENPRPKLDVDKLLSEDRGLPQLLHSATNILMKPGDDIENMRKTVNLLQHWSHRLFPKYTFDDFLTKCETLGKKRPIRTHLRKVRTGQIPI